MTKFSFTSSLIGNPSLYIQDGMDSRLRGNKQLLDLIRHFARGSNMTILCNYSP